MRDVYTVNDKSDTTAMTKAIEECAMCMQCDKDYTHKDTCKDVLIRGFGYTTNDHYNSCCIQMSRNGNTHTEYD